MTQIGLTLVWCVIQVTIVSVAAGVCYALFRRRGPDVGSAVAVTGLLAIMALTLMCVSPWPSWRSLPCFDTDADHVVVETEAPIQFEPTASPRQVKAELRFSEYFEAFWSELRSTRAPSPVAAEVSRWPAVVAWMFAGGVALGLIRLAVGIIATRSCYQKSHVLRDDELLEVADVLRAELNCLRTVELRQSDDLNTAATIGWRRPVILLPAHWHTWSASERRAVLAHELAHIHHYDYPTWVCAQLGLVLHFYHPLVHWLVSRLRLDQELAADAVAARLSGGSQSYLTTLAELALRQPERSPGWPARCFLPTRRTFMRRIEMLRDRKELVSATPIGVRASAVAAVLVAVVFAGGLRPGPLIPLEGMAAAQSQGDGDAQRGEPSGQGPFELSYVPRDAVAVAALRPSAMLARANFQPLATMLANEGGLQDVLGVSLDQIDQVTIAFLVDDSPKRPFEPAVTIIRLGTPRAATALVETLVGSANRVAFHGQNYLRDRRAERFAFQPDARTLVLASEEGFVRRAIVAGKAGAQDTTWSGNWQQVADADAALLLDVSMLRPSLDEQLANARGSAHSQLAALSPIWKNVSTVTFQAMTDGSLIVEGDAQVIDADQGNAVKETLAALVTLGKHSISQVRRTASERDAPSAAKDLLALDLVDRALDQTKVSQTDEKVTLALRLGGNASQQLVKTLAPAISAARQAADRTLSTNNLKQLSLAMLAYHEHHGHFPPAVSLGPDGKTKHSWRVAILPYLEAQDLHAEYRMDEPWDSENNKRVLAKMPAWFAHPSAKPGSVETAYYAITGPATLLAGGKETRILDVRDGLSNSIMFVESKRHVPWTQPVDIEYAPDEDLPDFGGFHESYFLAAFCDGAVTAISTEIDDQQLRKLITINDGQPVNLENVDRARLRTSPRRQLAR